MYHPKVILFGLQFVICGILLLRSQYAMVPTLAMLTMMLFWTSQFLGLIKWASMLPSKAPIAQERLRILAPRHHIRDEKQRNAGLELEIQQLRVAHALLKTDFEQTRRERDVFLKKHLDSRSLTNSLLSQMQGLVEALDEEHSNALKQKRRLRSMLSLIHGFFQYALLAGKRIRFLSASEAKQQKRFSAILACHIGLRVRYLKAVNDCLEARRCQKDLKERLQTERSAHQKLRNAHEKFSAELEAEGRRHLELQAQVYSLVANYDSLKADYAQLLTSHDRLKNDYSGFYDNLQEISNIVQVTQDVAQLGLNNLQQSATFQSLKSKQDLMKVGQSLDLVRLNVTELLVNIGIVLNREIGRNFVVPTLPGSVEDAVRRLRTIVEAIRQRDSRDNSEFKFYEGTIPQDMSFDSIDASTFHQHEMVIVAPRAVYNQVNPRIEAGKSGALERFEFQRPKP